jgi:hypothetical protein
LLDRCGCAKARRAIPLEGSKIVTAIEITKIVTVFEITKIVTVFEITKIVAVFEITKIVTVFEITKIVTVFEITKIVAVFEITKGGVSSSRCNDCFLVHLFRVTVAMQVTLVCYAIPYNNFLLFC